MTNRLTKLALATYSPAVPYKPASPAYCIQSPYKVPGRYVVLSYTAIKEGGKTYYRPNYTWVPAHTEFKESCYPATPEVKAVASSTSYSAVTGWNAGARSIDALQADGYFEFGANSSPFGVVAGLSAVDYTRLPSEQSHAFYLHGDTVDILEYGQVVASAVAEHEQANTYRISRSGSTVTYSVGAWSMTSGTPSAGAVILDVSLYASGDYVDSPVLMLMGAAGDIAGELQAFTGYMGNAPYAQIVGQLQRFTGSAAENSKAVISGQLHAFSGVMADRPYGAIAGSLSSFTGEADGGYPQISIVTVTGIMAPFSGIAFGKTGEIASLEGSLKPFTGMAADRPYGAVSGELNRFTGNADSGRLPANTGRFTSALLLVDIYYPSRVSGASFSSGIEIGGTFSITLHANAYFHSQLLIGNSWSSSYEAQGRFTSSLRVGGNMAGMAAGESATALFSSEPAQYAVNAKTGALTQYSGFDFTGFARAGQALYGCKPDGVYLIRQGDDDGDPIQAFVDCGSTDYETSALKRTESVYLGIDTDASVVLTVQTETSKIDYPIANRGVMTRAVLAKGVSGRLWNIAIKINDATHFELDAIEARAGASVRRLGRR